MKIKKIFTLFLLVSQICTWLLLHFSLAEKSLLLSQKKEQVALLKEKNTNLEKEVALSYSLLSIKEKALKLGLTEIEKTVILRGEDVLAHNE